MRIISGKYKGRRFDVPRTFKARPTTDFAKESLFNILSTRYIDFTDHITALDLFAGTGSISLELLSRGCSKVVSIEKDYAHWQHLRQVSAQLKDSAWSAVHADVKKVLEAPNQSFNFIFADPPYALEWLGQIPDMVFATNILAPSADDDCPSLFVLEHGRDYDFTQHPHFVEHRTYGSVNFSFFQ